jgi:hypothetical protein
MTLPEMLVSTQVPLNTPVPSTQTDLSPAYSSPAYGKIQALDLEPIKFKLVKEKSWPLQKAEAVEKLYKTYLLLFALYPGEEHVPTADIDEMWHGHILDTQKYMADCHEIFGYYLHHYPYLGMLGAEDAVVASAKFAATRARFVAHGAQDPAEAAHCGGGCGGHGCGGHSCGGHSCGGHGGGDHGGGGHSDGGSGHGHTDNGPIASCTSSVPSTPLRDEWKKKKEKPPKKKPANENPAPKKKPFWKRIFRALRRTPQLVLPRNKSVKLPARSRWDMSVDPRAVNVRGRPTRAELLQLLETLPPENTTRH